MSFALPKDRDAFEAKIRAEAVSYRVHLFLGRGEWDRADAGTPAEALAIGAAMSAAHPGCQALPVYYAIEASGHATTIKPAQLQEGNPMSTSVSETHAPKKYARAPIVDDKAQERKAANAERMRAVRAKKKAVNEPKQDPAAPAPVPTAIERVAKCGLADDRAQAIAAARAVYGKDSVVGKDFQVKKNARGEFFWGPIDAPAPAPAATAKAPRAKAAAQPGKRALAPKLASDGLMPSPPNFAAETHKRFRPKLAELVKMAEVGDIAGLEAFVINPISSSPKAMDKYRNLAVIALKARAAAKA